MMLVQYRAEFRFVPERAPVSQGNYGSSAEKKLNDPLIGEDARNIGR